ncbi:SAM-dependent methyltransferase [Nocardiopsis mwathae]|uniref:SAM-dependent methyltransferase n=1 Tax=Nocardiopsis mwathae TaxID=1472723 RepID=A0A7X0D469_9ACTN|nr:class I SAM-dependent methyltransferase [Nocardiopsis mwathae]MBB6170958.1 SAM-dependent methyltransferase [Nocardiopsis mwathae]
MVDTPPAPSVLDTYEKIAGIYDAVTDVPGYPTWMKIFIDLIEGHGCAGKRLLDLGCGTGKSSVAFKDLGYEVTGVDISPAMIDIARGKKEMADIEFVVGDLRRLPGFPVSFDAATAAGEQFHYLADTAELRAALESVRGALRPGGLLVFELNTAGTFAALCAAPAIRRGPGSLAVLDGTASAPFVPGGGVEVVMDCFTATADGTWERLESRHPHRHFPRDDVAAAVAESGFDLVAVYGIKGGKLHEGLDESADLKAFFVARNTASAQ